MAILSAEILEAARDGKSVAEIMSMGATILTREDVMDGVAGDDPRSASGGDISGRNQAGDGSRPDSIGEHCIDYAPRRILSR